MATVKHTVKVTNTWKFSPVHTGMCVHDLVRRCIIPIGADPIVAAEMSNLSNFRSISTPYIQVRAVRRLEWLVEIAYIEQHLAELLSVDIIRPSEINVHRLELTKLAMATRSPSRPTPLRAGDLEAAAAMMELYMEPTAVPATPLPATVALTTTNGAIFAIPRHFTSAYRQISSVVEYYMCGPSVPLQFSTAPDPSMYVTAQISEIDRGDCIAEFLSKIAPDRAAPPPVVPVCPPAPRKVRTQRVIPRDPLTGAPACARRLQF